MTTPQGPSGLNPDAAWGVTANDGSISGLPARTQDNVTAALKNQVQQSSSWQNSTASVWGGLRRGTSGNPVGLPLAILEFFGRTLLGNGTWNALTQLNTDVAAFFSGKWTALTNIGNDIVTLINEVGGQVITDVSNAINEAKQKADAAADQFAQLLDDLLGTGHGITDFVNWLQARRDETQATWDAFWQGIFGGSATGKNTIDFKSAAAALTSIANTAKTNSDSALLQLATLIDQVLGGGHGVQDLAQYIINTWDGLVSGWNNLWDGIFGTSGSTGKTAADVKTAAQSVTSTANTAKTNADAAGSGVNAIVTGAGKTTPTATGNFISDTWNNLVNGWNNLWDGIFGTTGSAGKTASDVKTAAASVTSTANTAATNATNAQSAASAADGKAVAAQTAVAAAQSFSSAMSGRLFGPATDVYVVDFTAKTVLKRDSAGLQSVVTSGLNTPRDLALDSLGNLYIADQGGNVFRVDPEGNQTVFTPNAGVGLCVDSADNVYRTIGTNVFRITAGGGTQSVGFTGLSEVRSCAADLAGNIYALDSTLDKVFKMTPGGVQTDMGFTGLVNPWDISVDKDGSVYVTDFDAKKLYKMASDGTQSEVPISLGTGGQPYSVACDGFGNVYLSRYSPAGVFKLAADGSQTQIDFTGLAGTDNATGVAVKAVAVQPTPVDKIAPTVVASALGETDLGADLTVVTGNHQALTNAVVTGANGYLDGDADTAAAQNAVAGLGTSIANLQGQIDDINAGLTTPPGGVSITASPLGWKPGGGSGWSISGTGSPLYDRGYRWTKTGGGKYVIGIWTTPLSSDQQSVSVVLETLPAYPNGFSPVTYGGSNWIIIRSNSAGTQFVFVRLWKGYAQFGYWQSGAAHLVGSPFTIPMTPGQGYTVRCPDAANPYKFELVSNGTVLGSYTFTSGQAPYGSSYLDFGMVMASGTGLAGDEFGPGYVTPMGLTAKDVGVGAGLVPGVGMVVCRKSTADASIAASSVAGLPVSFFDTVVAQGVGVTQRTSGAEGFIVDDAGLYVVNCGVKLGTYTAGSANYGVCFYTGISLINRPELGPYSPVVGTTIVSLEAGQEVGPMVNNGTTSAITVVGEGTGTYSWLSIAKAA